MTCVRRLCFSRRQSFPHSRNADLRPNLEVQTSTLEDETHAREPSSVRVPNMLRGSPCAPSARRATQIQRATQWAQVTFASTLDHARAALENTSTAARTRVVLAAARLIIDSILMASGTLRACSPSCSCSLLGHRCAASHSRVVYGFRFYAAPNARLSRAFVFTRRVPQQRGHRSPAGRLPSVRYSVLCREAAVGTMAAGRCS